MQTPVLMLHGMNCTGQVWADFRAFFEARGARVYTPTLRPDARVSLGQKPNRALREVGFSDYVAEVEREAQRIEAETGQRPAVIGHSMGGLLAQALAERGRVCAAVFISPSAPAGVRDFRARVFWAGVSFGYAVKLGPWAIKPERRMLDGMVFNALPEAERAGAQDGMVYESGRAFKDLANWPIDESKIHVPVLTVAATRDRLVPAKLTRLTGKKYAAIGGELREYPEHAHWLYSEPGWEKPAAEIYDWLVAATARGDVGASARDKPREASAQL
jgi:pimeloyl-ACP methyl ester carboxylesterase